MTPSEIYELQVALRAVKTCAGCAQVKPVAEFAYYGMTICDACDAAPRQVEQQQAPIAQVVPDELENYWASLKARVGVGVA